MLDAKIVSEGVMGLTWAVNDIVKNRSTVPRGVTTLLIPEPPIQRSIPSCLEPSNRAWWLSSLRETTMRSPGVESIPIPENGSSSAVDYNDNGKY